MNNSVFTLHSPVVKEQDLVILMQSTKEEPSMILVYWR